MEESESTPNVETGDSTTKMNESPEPKVLTDTEKPKVSAEETSKQLEHDNEKHGGPESEYESAEEEDLKEAIAKPVEPIAKPIETPVKPIETPVKPGETPVQSVEPVETLDKLMETSKKPIENPDKPVENPDKPVENPDKPVENPDKPFGNPDKPVENPDKPVENSDKKVENPNKPVENPEKPVKNPEKPVENPEKPVENPEKPVENPGKPVENPGKPVENPGKPVENPGKPVENPGKPVENPGKPVENPGKPVENPGKPVENPGKLVESPVKIVESPDKPVENVSVVSQLKEVPTEIEQPKQVKATEPNPVINENLESVIPDKDKPTISEVPEVLNEIASVNVKSVSEKLQIGKELEAVAKLQDSESITSIEQTNNVKLANDTLSDPIPSQETAKLTSELANISISSKTEISNVEADMSNLSLKETAKLASVENTETPLTKTEEKLHLIHKVESVPKPTETLNEFLDEEFNLSGEMQGDLLDEEGHEGGMEERADMGEDFSDEGVILDEIDIDKAVTNKTDQTDDSYEETPDRHSPEDKQYLPEDGEYDDDEEGLNDGDDEDGEEYVEGEREQGDGEESVSPTPNKEKVLDDDEDRRNPQYIPKKGAFYEHDDRLTSDQEQVDEEKEEEPESEKQDGKKKKLWLDDGRWNHDMFNQDEQAPKSKDELLNSYGYDIRSEDCPPRARRRRRYGRGPNKYTRNWKDEDAYHKGGSESGQESEGDSRKGNFRQSGGRRGGRRNERGVRRGRGKLNNRRRGDNDNMSEEEDEEEVFDQESRSKYPNNRNNEAPSNLEKDFPPLIPPTEDKQTEDKNKDNNVITFRGTKAPFPQSQNKPSVVEKSEENSDVSQNVRTITFENSRYTSRQNSVESKPVSREEVRVDPRNFDRGLIRSPRGRARGREHYNAMKGKGEGYVMRGSGRGYSVEKNRNDRPFKPSYNQRNQFTDDMPPRPKSREEQIEDIMKDIPPPTMRDESVSQHNVKSHGESRPKRYSSLRQSRAPETNINPPSGGSNFRQNAPPPRHSQSQQYYDKTNNYKAANVYPERMSSSNNNPVNHNTPVNPLITGSPLYSTYNPPYQEPFAIRASLNNAPRMYPPPPTAQPVALTTPYLTQAPQTSPAIINYVPGPGPNHPPPPGMIGPSGMHQYPYQQYNGPQPTSSPPVVTPATAMGATVVVSQPQEMYRGGVTYYNTQSQQLLPMRMPPQRRAKAAIPIVDPTQESLAAQANMHLMSHGSYSGETYTRHMTAEEMSIADGALASSNSMPVET